ncbi:EAL domain-containing protein [Parashewanella curva]|nr:EAL domain-containing protein [Parashewanella curva]
MFSSKFFQTILFSIFGTGLVLLYQFQLAKFQQTNHERLTSYQKQVSKVENWPKDGLGIYQIIKAITPIRFFQYIDKEDTENNYTTGQLVIDKPYIINQLFPNNVGSYQQTDSGRIQVKLDVTKTNQAIISDFINIAIVLVSSYVLIALCALLCFSRVNHYLNQLIQLIEQIPNRKSAIYSTTSFPKQFKLVEDAISQAKKLYAERVSQISVENQQLNKEARQDQLTGLLTRLIFYKKLEDAAKSDNKINGSIIVLRASELGYINQIQGRNAGDAYLIKITKLLLSMTKTTAKASHYRISSADFAIVLPEVSFQGAQTLLPKLKSLLDEYQQLLKTPSVAHIGLIPYKNQIPSITTIEMLESSLSVAETLGSNCFYAMDKETDSDKIGDGHWKQTLNYILKSGGATFYYQPIQSCNSQTAFYQEFLTRFQNEDSRILPTSAVITMAERLDIVTELDKMVITKAMRLLIKKPTLRSSIGINISAASALNKSFQAWLHNQLKQHANIASKLVFEVGETGMQVNTTAAANFVKTVHKSSARVCFEKFGTGFTAFKFLKEVRPDFIKLDSSFTKDIHFNEDNRFIVRMLVDIAKRLGIPVIATNIESQAEKIEFEQLLVDGLQGFFISSPKILRAA